MLIKSITDSRAVCRIVDTTSTYSTKSVYENDFTQPNLKFKNHQLLKMLSAKRRVIESEWNTSDSDNKVYVKKKRRVKKAGAKRGMYFKGLQNYPKLRITSDAEKGAHWRDEANANGIPIPTAYGWLRRADELHRRGG